MRFLRFLGVLLVIAVLLAGVQMLRGVPAPTVSYQSSQASVPGPAPKLPWPLQGQAAVSVEGIGPMGTYGGNTPVPIGSVAKIMTALLVLEKHPLSLNQQGPTLTLTSADVQAYQAEQAVQQSVVPVAAGEQLTEYQLLEGLLVRSGNNLAQILARWVGGSQANFVKIMNARAKALGLSHTTYADASGLSSSTVSTAQDQLKLAALAMQNPVFAQIVAEPQVTLPVAGTVYNYNGMVGHFGVIGIKTGSTLAAGGCFVFAMQRSIGGKNVTVLGAVFGEGTGLPLQAALNASVQLGTAALNAVKPVQVLASGSRIATIKAPWGATAAVQATQGVQFYGWGGLPVQLHFSKKVLGTPLAAGTRVGQVQVQVGSQSQAVPLKSTGTIPAPSLRWRLTRL